MVSTRDLAPLPGKDYNLQTWDYSELIELNDTSDIESRSRLQEIDSSIKIENEYPTQVNLLPETKIDLDTTPESQPSYEPIQQSPTVQSEISLQPLNQTRESMPIRMITRSTYPGPDRKSVV